MAASVYKICTCRDQLKCRHPWWFSFKRRGKGQPRIRKSLDVVLETHLDSKVVAEAEASRLRIGIVDTLNDPACATLSPRTRELLGLPAPPPASVRQTLTVSQLLQTYKERHLAHTASAEKQGYQIDAIIRTKIVRPAGVALPFGDWLVVDVSADALERLREARLVREVRIREKAKHMTGGTVAANRDLRLLRAAFNWALDKDLVERSPFKRGDRTTVKLSRELARSRRLQAGESERLLAKCGSHLRNVVEAALETGCRRGELLLLQWRQVQLEAPAEIWLPAGKTKTGRARRIPISDRLRKILEMRRDAVRAALELTEEQALPEALYVFGNELGQRHGAIKTAWRLACERADVRDLHFHDLRREAGSRWLEGGVPLHTIREWLGHTNIAQTSTYLATTIAGGHAAMRRFEEHLGRLTPIDTGGGTPLLEGAQTATITNTETQQHSTKH
jgi:integrase